MRYPTPEAFRSALDQRLKNHAAQTGIPLVRLRKTIAFDRFLARLVAVASDRWVLKGALALYFRLGSGTTRWIRPILTVSLAGARAAGVVVAGAAGEARACRSRVRRCQASLVESQQALLELHVQAFEWFGGVLR